MTEQNNSNSTAVEAVRQREGDDIDNKTYAKKSVKVEDSITHH